MITEDYVSFETAKLLRENGFNEKTYASIKVFAGHNYKVNGEWITPEYDTIIPTLQMAMKWLREIYKLEVRSTYDYDKDSWWGYINPMFEEADENSDIYQKALGFDYPGKTYEQACEAAIKYCLENLL